MSSLEATTEPKPDWRDAFRPGWLAIQRQWAPILLIQVLAIGITVGYLTSPAVRSVVDQAAQLKVQIGYAFAFAAGFTAAAILPEAVKTVVRSGGPWTRARVQRSLALGVTYGLASMVVDWQYQFLNHLVGSGRDPVTLALKIFVDQFIISWTFTVPFLVLFSLFLEERFKPGFHFKRWWTSLGTSVYRTHILPVQLIGWAVWVPALIGIFSLPLPVQLPVAMMISAAWSLILSFLTARSTSNQNGVVPRP